MGFFDTNTPVTPLRPPNKPRIAAWSFSRLIDWEQCAHRLYLKVIKKHKTAQSPAAERGEQLHKRLEAYIKGESDDYPEITFDKTKIDALRDAFPQRRVVVEENWGFDPNWRPVDWFAKDIWARIKLDALYFTDDRNADVIDFKTGKSKGNELKHADQGMIYAVAAFIHYPRLKEVSVQFWYIDHDHIAKRPIAREQAALYQEALTRRARALTQDTVFKPRPSKWTCRFCGVKDHCPYRADHDDTHLSP